MDDLLHCVARPEEVSDVVIKLSATTFVQVRAAVAEEAFLRGCGNALRSNLVGRRRSPRG